jgi:hypothetical protein
MGDESAREEGGAHSAAHTYGVDGSFGYGGDDDGFIRTSVGNRAD